MKKVKTYRVQLWLTKEQIKNIAKVAKATKAKKSAIVGQCIDNQIS